MTRDHPRHSVVSGAPTQAALLELAARVEAASGPDRELDFAIAELVDAHVISELADLADMPGHRAIVRRHVPFLRYTAFLDAAMTLVPNSIEVAALSFKLERFYLGNGTEKCHASVWDGLGIVSSLDTETDAATPALALTAAALRSRAAQGDPA